MADEEGKQETTSSMGNMTLFFCNFCNECYSQEKSYKLHFRAHKPLTCEICGKVFFLKRELTAHYRSHDLKEYACELCNKGFYSKNGLKKHKCIHHAEKSHICDVCKSTFSSEVELKKHYSTHTTYEGPYVCDICQECFLEKSSFQEHMFTHITKKNNSDEDNDSIEGKIVMDTVKLENSQSNHKFDIMFTHITKKNNSDEVNDSIEGKIVKDTVKLENSQSNHKFDICEKVFKTKTLLKNHCHIHKVKESRKGNISERAFSELPSSTNRALGKPHVCDICKKSFKTKTLLKNHCRIHKGKKSLKGNIAERVFSELPSSTNHTVIKPHVCDICKKKFKTKTLLKNHCHIHKEKQSRKGNIPERVFSELPSSTNRTMVKPHVCDLCQKSFSRKSSLMSHGCTRKRI